MPKTTKPLIERVHDKIDKSGDCWQWTDSTGDHGYGRIKVDGKIKQAHAVVYALHKGEVPEGLELDHVCRNRSCVNPDHLEAVTHQENSKRAKKKQARCMRGHEPTSNTASSSCSACRKLLNKKKYYRFRKGGVGVSMETKLEIKNVSLNIRRLRKERGWSIYDLSAELGTDHTTVVKWEKSIPNISLNSMAKIASIFDIPIRDLFNPTTLLEGSTDES